MKELFNSAPILTATNFDLPSLHLLHTELESTLHDAEAHLNQFADDYSQAPLLLDSVDTLAQASKVLRLITLEEGAVLAQALSDNLQQLYDDNNDADDEHVMLVSEGIMTLNQYIEFVLLKQTPEPSLILSIINQLLAQVKQPSISLEQLMSNKNSSLVIANPQHNFQSVRKLGLDSTRLLSAFRAGLTVALQARTRPTDPTDLLKLDAMQAACELIAKQSTSLFWQAANAAVTDLAQVLPLTATQKRALIFVEQQFNEHLPLTDARFADLVRFASIRNNVLAQQVTQQLSTNSLTPDQMAVMRHFLFGPKRETIDTLNDVIQQEIDLVKVASDNYARQENLNACETELNSMVERLQNLSLVFKMLRLTDVSAVLQQEVEQVKQWPQQPTPEDFDRLLESLMVAENASSFVAKSYTPGANYIAKYNPKISTHQLDTAYQTLITKSRLAVSMIENAFNDYLNDPKRDIMNLINVPEMLRNISGACLFLSLPQSSQLLKRVSNYLDGMIQHNTQGIAEDKLAKIADVVMAADYYLESHEVNKPVSQKVIMVGKRSLQQLVAA